MARYFKHDLNFMGHRKIFFAISLFLVVLSIGALAIRGLNLGIEFVGGTNITFTNTGELSIEEMRAACDEVGLENPIIQTSDTGTTHGFIIRTSETSPEAATAVAIQLTNNLQLESSSYEVQTIGPDWGSSVLKTSLKAFIIAMLLIICYIAIRFEWKMSLTAILGLCHDLLIVIGIYALFGREVTPNAIAALLTIMGYSLYDTVVVFHRINENASPDMQHSYMTIANHSVNQVFARTINTTLTSLLPVLAMLFFGGDTLKDFAFAMTIGLILGSYSSFGISVPIFSLWKSREPEYAPLAVKYGEGVGDFSGDQLPEMFREENLPQSVVKKAAKNAREKEKKGK